jgi:hypothetical protein
LGNREKGNRERENYASCGQKESRNRRGGIEGGGRKYG